MYFVIRNVYPFYHEKSFGNLFPNLVFSEKHFYSNVIENCLSTFALLDVKSSTRIHRAGTEGNIAAVEANIAQNDRLTK